MGVIAGHAVVLRQTLGRNQPDRLVKGNV